MILSQLCFIKPTVMPRRKNQSTSAVPGKRTDPKEEANPSQSKRPEGSVNEHRERINRNHQMKNEPLIDESNSKK
jgi:hypothetical protein